MYICRRCMYSCTYHHKLGKCPCFHIFRIQVKIYWSGHAWKKVYIISFNHIFGKYLEQRKECTWFVWSITTKAVQKWWTYVTYLVILCNDLYELKLSCLFLTSKILMLLKILNKAKKNICWWITLVVAILTTNSTLASPPFFPRREKSLKIVNFSMLLKLMFVVLAPR